MTAARAKEFANDRELQTKLGRILGKYEHVIVIAGKEYRKVLAKFWDAKKFVSLIQKGGSGDTMHYLDDLIKECSKQLKGEECYER